LRAAYRIAKAIHKDQEDERRTLENRFIMKMSSIVIHAIASIETNTKMSQKWFHTTYVTSESPNPLLKLGYTISVLIEKLMKDRYTNLDCLFAQPQTSSNGAEHSEPAEIPLFVNLKDVKQEPIEIKEEIEEPEVELEPIEDVFCPSTGSARPPTQNPFLSGYPEEDDDGDDDNDDVDDHVKRSINDVLRKKNEEIDVGGTLRSALSAIGMTPSGSKSVTEQLKNAPLEKCYLCGKFSFDFLSTKEVESRRDFLSQIVIKSPQQRKKMAAFAASNEDAFFCLSHFPKGRGTKPQPTVARIIKVPDVNAGKNCDLCSSPQLPCRSSPANRAEAEKFFASVEAGTVKQRNQIEWFLFNNERATICRKHFEKLEYKKRSLHYAQTLEDEEDDEVNEMNKRPWCRQEMARRTRSSGKSPEAPLVKRARAPEIIRVRANSSSNYDSDVKEEPFDDERPSGI
ncbi:hypothetical protein PMAYCL1PPCAC_04704, partial [Pristionchus mayeri]